MSSENWLVATTLADVLRLMYIDLKKGAFVS